MQMPTSDAECDLKAATLQSELVLKQLDEQRLHFQNAITEWLQKLEQARQSQVELQGDLTDHSNPQPPEESKSQREESKSELEGSDGSSFKIPAAHSTVTFAEDAKPSLPGLLGKVQEQTGEKVPRKSILKYSVTGDSPFLSCGKPKLQLEDRAEGNEDVTRLTSRASERQSWFGKSNEITDLRKGGTSAWLTEETGVTQRVLKTLGQESILNHVLTANSLTEARQGTLWKFVHGQGFQGVCSAVILAHAFFIGLSADEEVRRQMEGKAVNATFRYIEFVFNLWFMAELGTRLAAERLHFFWGPERKWNLLDSILVILSLLDLVLNGIHEGNMPRVNVSKLLRLARFVRIVRLARVVRSFQNFRVLVFSIAESVGSLFWCFFVVFFVIYLFAILFLQGVAEYFQELGPRIEAKTVDKFESMYKGVPLTMRTLFMTISGGLDWSEALEPVKEANRVYEWIFVFYIFFMVFGVLNVVVGAFVATTAEIASKDRGTFVKNEMQRLKRYAEKIKTFFQEADLDQSGMLSWDEFSQHLEKDEVKAYFQALELDVSQAKVLFKLLDADDSDQVGLDEFIEGCLRLKGSARSIDVNMLLYENEIVFGKLLEFMAFAHERFDDIERKLGIPVRAFPSGSSTRSSKYSTKGMDFGAETPGSRLTHAMRLLASVEREDE